MSHMKGRHRSIHAQVNAALSARLAIGESRNAGKRGGVADKKVYSRTTFENYSRWCTNFGEWCKSNYGETNLKDMTPHVQEYIDTLPSAWTQKSVLSGLRKVYGSDAVGEVHTQARSRDQIARSRTESDYTANHFSMEKHADDIALMQALGLRRREYNQLVGGMVTYKGDTPYICGIHGKGGRVRDVRIPNGNEAIINRIQSVPEGHRVLPNISEAAPVHSERASYACTLYTQLARPISQVPPDEQYHCRGEMAGITYDRKAMEEVARSMGHSRVSVIAENYLWKLGR